jgi:phospholipase C
VKAAAALALALAFAVPAAGAPKPVPRFEHVIVVVFENKESAQVLGSSAAPTFNGYAARDARLTQYFAVAHPSLPNYLALVSGSTHGIRTDCTTCTVATPSLVDTIERSGRTWKAYAEGLPTPGYLGATRGRYVKKHNPFLYFRNVVSKPARRARVVPLTQLRRDLAARRLPDFVFVIPDTCHDMHDCPISVGDAWLRRFAPPFLTLEKSVLFVVFDEGRSTRGGGGQIAGLALGTAVLPGSRFTGVTSHYGLLRTIEQAWGLPLLGASAQARPITGIWR